MALEQVGWGEVVAKKIVVVLVDATLTQNWHKDELTLIFNKFLCVP